MDPDILRSFEVLRSTLRWRPLTANLESCEHDRFLFFRITLRLGPTGDTYAGFSSGAPFMLARDGAVNKKGFFLRHWVRQDEDPVDAALPLFDSKHLRLAIVKDVMIVRVDVDREMNLVDTFKSVPFATWMFQVVQVDALIEGKNGVRFAFAIERTVTTEERTVIQSNVEHTKQQTKLQKAASKTGGNLRVAPVRIPSQSLVMYSKPISLQSSQLKVAANAPAASQSMSASKQGTPSRVAPHPSLTIANPSGIVAKTLNPRNAITLSAPTGNVNSFNFVAQATRARPIARANESSKIHSNAVPASEKKVFHPFLRFWENRPLDDPYEPFFIVNSDDYTKKSSEVWQVEDSARQFHFKFLQSQPGAHYPGYFRETLDANHLGKISHDLLITHPSKRVRLSNCSNSKSRLESAVEFKEEKDPLGKTNVSELPSFEGHEMPSTAKHPTGQVDDDDIPSHIYNSTVKAAAEYNSNLGLERIELQSWLVEDRRVREAEGSNDEEDALYDEDYGEAL